MTEQQKYFYAELLRDYKDWFMRCEGIKTAEISTDELLKTGRELLEKLKGTNHSDISDIERIMNELTLRSV